MRRRNKGILLWLSEVEYDRLKRKVMKTGLSMQAYIRALIDNSPLRERPPMEFFTVLEELRKIGTNMNQIARQANSKGFIDTNEYWKNVKALEDAISDIKEEARK